MSVELKWQYCVVTNSQRYGSYIVHKVGRESEIRFQDNLMYRLVTVKFCWFWTRLAVYGQQYACRGSTMSVRELRTEVQLCKWPVYQAPCLGRCFYLNDKILLSLSAVSFRPLGLCQRADVMAGTCSPTRYPSVCRYMRWLPHPSQWWVPKRSKGISISSNMLTYNHSLHW